MTNSFLNRFPKLSGCFITGLFLINRFQTGFKPVYKPVTLYVKPAPNRFNRAHQCGLSLASLARSNPPKGGERGRERDYAVKRQNLRLFSLPLAGHLAL